MKIKEIIDIIEEKYPTTLKQDWDNVGLMVGDINNDVTEILVTLDVTSKVIDEAIELGANLIISHHPLIFNEIKNVTSQNVLGRKITKLIKNNVSVYSMHTNLDIAQDGINDYLAAKFELQDVKTIIDKETHKNGFIRYGKLKNEMSLNDLTLFVKDKLNLEHSILITNDKNKIVKSVALCSGSGKEFLSDAIKLNVDCYITGDYTYHYALDALEENFNVIDAGHFGTEYIVIDIIEKYLKSKTDLQIIKTSKMTNPFTIY